MLEIITNILKPIKNIIFNVSLILNIVLIISLIFLIRGCEKPRPEVIINTVEVPVPGKEGVSDTIYIPKPYKVVNPINTELLRKYNSLKDTVAKLNMYKDAIAERDYNEIYEDSTQKIEVYTKTQGKLLKQALKYEIKPYTITYTDTIKIPPIKLKNKLLFGVELGVPTELLNNNPVLKGNILLQNKKDNIISLSYDSNNYIWIGYNLKF